MLNWPTYSFSEAANDLEDIETKKYLEFRLPEEMLILRKQLIEARDEIYDKYGFDNGLNKKYMFDLEFGLKFYEILKGKVDNRTVSKDDIWRYLSVKVIPDVVHARFGPDKNHYYKLPRRIYLKQIWWYIHISWSNNSQETFELLKNNTTDTIQALVERPGLGYNIELYREIMKQYTQYEDSNRMLLRKVMILNTARVKLMSPELYPGGIEGYVKSLFEAVNQ